MKSPSLKFGSTTSRRLKQFFSECAQSKQQKEKKTCENIDFKRRKSLGFPSSENVYLPKHPNCSPFIDFLGNLLADVKPKI